MFATSDKKSAGPQPVSAVNDKSGGKPASPANPLWQSLALTSGSLQAKLTLGQPDDPYEQEADRVADQVMRIATAGGVSSPTDGPSLNVQRKCEGCEDEDEQLQRSSEAGGANSESPAPSIVQEALKSGGHQLDPTLRSFFEPRFGRDLSSVRVHTDSLADESARKVAAGTSVAIHGTVGAVRRKGEGPFETTPEFQKKLESTKGGGEPLPHDVQTEIGGRMGADFADVRVHTGRLAHEMSESINSRAFTLGRDIYFGHGNYAPQVPESRSLIAHELAHTVQQKASVQRKIQRSMKFEFQTENFVWMVDAGDRNPQLLERKLGPAGPKQESGNAVAYLSVGKHGGPARAAGNVFVEAEGDLIMKEAMKDVDKTKPAQIIRTYMFTTGGVTEDSVKNKFVTERPLKLVEEIDNAVNEKMKDKYNPNTFEFKYVNDENAQLFVHLDKEGKFQKGHVEFMRVGRDDKMTRKGKPPVDLKKGAQYTEIWRIKDSANYLGKPANVELVPPVKKASGTAKAFAPGTYEKNYYLATEFVGNELKKDAKRQDVHVDKDGTLQPGHVELMVRENLPASEQTAIELQSEHGGYLEFETPKWFRSWPELKMRIEDAVAMTRAMRSKKNNVTDRVLLSAMQAKKGKKKLGRVVTWPEAYSTDHLKTKEALKKGKLLIEIVDENWFAKIQGSEGIRLSEYGSLLKEHGGEKGEQGFFGSSVEFVVPLANQIFAKAFGEFKIEEKNKALNETLFADLKGFLQLIITYIVRGQTENLTTKPSKYGLLLMARTNFHSMYEQLLSKDEKALFKMILGSKTTSSIWEVLQTPIAKFRLEKAARLKKTAHTLEETDPKKSASLNAEATSLEEEITLTADSPLFFAGYGSEKHSTGPGVYDWLENITKGKDKGKDLLASGGTSEAMSGRTVATKPGDKDYKLAQFEVRASIAFGGDTQPAANWVSYVDQVFHAAALRGADTPDDPSTPSVNEASKTGLKD